MTAVSLRYAVIAGVNKAGTSSLFVSLTSHPAVAGSAIKETRYFLPARYAEPLAPADVWEGYFADAPAGALRLEATPSYFYGGDAVARALDERLDGLHVIVALREPVARAVSFFAYQKVRLRFPPDLPMSEYLAEADRLTPADFCDPANEKFMAVPGSRYADYLPDWIHVLGTERLSVVYFEDLVRDAPHVLGMLARRLGIDPDAFPDTALSSENRTVAYKHAALQRVALAGNDRLERLFRRHPGLERRLRAVYYRINGRAERERVPQSVLDELAARFAEPNARLAQQLAAAGYPLPPWLGAQAA